MTSSAIEMDVPPTAGVPADPQQLVLSHFGFIWRLLRRLGLPESDADDAAQQVFLIGLSKSHVIRAGSERSFLYGCALNVAAKWRVARQRSEPLGQAQIDACVDPREVDMEGCLDRRRAHVLLDAVLDALPPDLRTVFVLFEIEQLSSVKIAELLHLPRGTVASRLRRARKRFERHVRRLERRLSDRGCPP